MIFQRYEQNRSVIQGINIVFEGFSKPNYCEKPQITEPKSHGSEVILIITNFRIFIYHMMMPNIIVDNSCTKLNRTDIIDVDTEDM